MSMCAGVLTMPKEVVHFPGSRATGVCELPCETVETEFRVCAADPSPVQASPGTFRSRSDTSAVGATITNKT